LGHYQLNLPSFNKPMNRILVVGLGNPILGDDGVGWRVAGEIARLTALHPEIDVDCVSLGGLSLMERITGWEQVILVDSITSGRDPVGTVTRMLLSDLPNLSYGHTTAAHDTSLQNALKVGRSMNIPLPEDRNIHIIAVEIERTFDFSENLSQPVMEAIPQAVAAVLELLSPVKKE
jgi:hydrogenase maturation protease